MTFNWTDIDGAVNPIRDPQPIVARLDELKGRLENATNEGRTADIALISALWHDQYDQWKECVQRHMKAQHEELSFLCDQAYLRIDWWKEWVSGTDPIAPPSTIQLEIIGEHPDDLRPKTWKQASRAIAFLPNMGVPMLEDPQAAFSAALSCYEKASTASLSAKSMIELHQAGKLTEQAMLEHNVVISKYMEASAHVETFLSPPT